MNPTLLDHLLVAVLVVVLPLEGFFEVRRLTQALRRGVPGARSWALAKTIVMQWGLVAALLAGWETAGRPWRDLGLVASDTRRTLIGAAATAVAAVLMWMQHRAVRGLSVEKRQRLVERTGDAILLLPTSAGERGLFAGVAVTAGVCEEALCRGFFLWYLQHWMGPWTAVVVAAVPFGLAHIYQGGKGAVRTGVIGLLVGALYVGTGSLLWPALVHVIVDLGAGMLSRFLTAPVQGRLEAPAALA